MNHDGPETERYQSSGHDNATNDTPDLLIFFISLLQVFELQIILR